MAKHMAPAPHTDTDEARGPVAATPEANAPEGAEDDVSWFWESDEQGPADGSRGGGHFASAPVEEQGEDMAQDSHARPRKRRGSIVSNVLIVIGVALLVAAGVIYFNNQRNYDKVDEANEQVAEYARLSEDGAMPPSVDWESLRAVNGDIVAWMQVPGTIINYPVYQTDNNDYYLDHAPDRSSSIGGSVFLDFENHSPGLVDPQTIIYGHHMRNGSQFKPIADMENQELFDGVSRIWYVTEHGPYDLVPLFVFYTTATDTYIRQFEFNTLDEFHEYLAHYFAGAVAKRADAEQVIQTCEHVMTFSTCNYYDGYGRTELVCVPRYEIPGTPEYEQYRQQRADAEAAAAAEAAAQQAAAEEAAASEGQW